jgi:two-component system chemotaxis sensor kinase CheA
MFTLPLLAVRESFRPEEKDVTRLAGGQEILSLRGKVLPVVRLHEVYAVPAEAASLKDGILLCLETRGESYCLFVDELLGQRQTVVKALPRILGNVPGVSSCSILDNGGISLILDVAGLFEKHSKLEGIR